MLLLESSIILSPPLKNINLLFVTCAPALLFTATLAQSADSYSVRAVRIIVPSGAGGITDILGRIIAQKLSDVMGQQCVIDNSAGANITNVAYKGSPQIVGALISGEIQIYNVASVATVLPHTKSGRLRILGVSTRKRLAVLPDVPTIAETVPGYEALGWNGILAPAGTPKPIVDRLRGEIAKVVRSSEFAAHLINEGAVAVGNTPAEFTTVIQADISKWAKVIREAGIRSE